MSAYVSLIVVCAVMLQPVHRRVCAGWWMVRTTRTDGKSEALQVLCAAASVSFYSVVFSVVSFHMV